MFERFTDRARRVLVIAQEEARKLGHGFIGTEHLLLGLMEEGQGLAAKALAELGFEPQAIRDRVLEAVPATPNLPPGAPPFTPRSKKVLEFSLREALQLGHNYIGTEHLLLGLIQEGEGVGAQVLVAAGVRLEQVRSKVIELLSGFTAPGSAHPVSPVTPAAAIVQERAKAEAGTQPLGTQHLLLAILGEEQSLGARVLASLGVTPEAVRERIASMGVVGTSDEVAPPRPAPAAPARFEVTLDNGITLRIHDDALAEEFRSLVGGLAASAGGPDVGEAVRQALLEVLRSKKPPEPPEDDAPAT